MAIDGYKTVSLPEPLLKRVQRFLKNNQSLGYRSPTEYIRDAVREKLQRCEQLEKGTHNLPPQNEPSNQ